MPSGMRLFLVIAPLHQADGGRVFAGLAAHRFADRPVESARLVTEASPQQVVVRKLPYGGKTVGAEAWAGKRTALVEQRRDALADRLREAQ